MQNGGQLLLLLVLIGFTVWVFSRGRRQQRAMQATQSRLHAGAEVMMTSGVYGRVVEVTDGGVLRVETSPGVVSRWDRRAVARIISTPDAEPALEDEPAEPAGAEPPWAEPADPQPVDVAEGEPTRRGDLILPVEPGAPGRTPMDPEPGRAPAAEPGLSTPESRAPLTPPKDVAPPDRD